MKLTPITASNVSFQYFKDMLQHTEDMHEEKIIFDKFYRFLNPLQNKVLGGYTVFILSVIPSFRDNFLKGFAL